MKNEKYSPAFPKSPVLIKGGDLPGRDYNELVQGQTGMDVRTWLAGQVLAGINHEEFNSLSDLADCVVRTADLVIERLELKKELE